MEKQIMRMQVKNKKLFILGVNKPVNSVQLEGLRCKLFYSIFVVDTVSLLLSMLFLNTNLSKTNNPIKYKGAVV